MKSLAVRTARELRKKLTPSEQILWNSVRNRQVDNYKITRQYPIFFEHNGKSRFFIADFYCHECRLIIEVDGGIHETQKEYDHLRELMLTELDFTIIRFSNSEILDNLPQVIEKIKIALNKLQ